MRTTPHWSPLSLLPVDPLSTTGLANQHGWGLWYDSLRPDSAWSITWAYGSEWSTPSMEKKEHQGQGRRKEHCPAPLLCFLGLAESAAFRLVCREAAAIAPTEETGRPSIFVTKVANATTGIDAATTGIGAPGQPEAALLRAQHVGAGTLLQACQRGREVAANVDVIAPSSPPTWTWSRTGLSAIRTPARNNKHRKRGIWRRDMVHEFERSRTRQGKRCPKHRAPRGPRMPLGKRIVRRSRGHWCKTNSTTSITPL